MWPISGQIADVIAITVQQVWGNATVLTTGAPIRFTDVPRGTFAVVRANTVLADLAADGGCAETLIEVLAGFAIWHKLVARVAGAVVTGEGVGAELGTLVDWRAVALIDS